MPIINEGDLPELLRQVDALPERHYPCSYCGKTHREPYVGRIPSLVVCDDCRTAIVKGVPTADISKATYGTGYGQGRTERVDSRWITFIKD